MLEKAGRHVIYADCWGSNAQQDHAGGEKRRERNPQIRIWGPEITTILPLSSYTDCGLLT